MFLFLLLLYLMFRFHVSFCFFPNTSICAKHGGKKIQEHNEATRDFLFVDPSHGSFVNGGILASFLFQICRSSR